MITTWKKWRVRLAEDDLLPLYLVVAVMKPEESTSDDSEELLEYPVSIGVIPAKSVEHALEGLPEEVAQDTLYVTALRLRSIIDEAYQQESASLIVDQVTRKK